MKGGEKGASAIPDGMPTLTARPDGLYEVARNWCIRFTVGGRLCSVVLMRGFTTDGASVPRFGWMFAGHPMESPRVCAALVHDWLYASHSVTRAVADAAYASILRLVGYPMWRVCIEYICLRAFGRKAWTRAYREMFVALSHGAIGFGR